MALDINQLKAAFAKKTEGSDGGDQVWQKYYPFYKIDFDATATFRFLPDADDDNPLGFIVENVYHELLINGQKKRLACLKMHGESSCPCCDLSKKHYDEGNTTMGKSFWRKKDYIAQGLVISSPIEYPIKPDENPVRLISMGPKIYKIVENAILKGDLDEMPTDFTNGCDFRITKTKQGEWADYSTSSFARKSTAISDEVLANPKFELYDLKKFRYAKTDRDQMETMIEAFLTGKQYEDKDGGTGSPALDTALTATKETAPAETVVAAALSAAPATAPAASGATKLTPAEILAKLKSRANVSKD